MLRTFFVTYSGGGVMAKLSWKPVRRGKRYCSPACGRGCTKAAHNSAVYQSRRLAKRLGEGWKPGIWENLGWHYSVIDKTGYVSVHGDRHGNKHNYTASDRFGLWEPEHGHTPEEAIQRLRQQAFKKLANLKRAVTAISKVRP